MHTYSFLKIFSWLFGFVLLLGIATSAYAATPSIVSIKLTGANTLTVVYSEAVHTNTWDYTNFTGNLSGLGVVSIAGSGTNVITLTLSGNPSTAGNSIGYITVGPGVTSLSTNASFPGGSYNVTSAQAPILSSVSITLQSIGSSFASLGTQINLTFTTSESVVNPTVTLLGHTIGVNGTGEGPFTVNYTVASGDAQGTIPATITFTDTNGNAGSATISVLSNGSGNSAGNISGTITSNANSSGVLYPGNSITFTLTPATAEPNARQVTGSYNGVPLSWYTTNNGATYIAVYTVAAGQGSTSYPVQIGSVTLIDQYGNTVGPFSGSDVQKTISATVQTGPISIFQTTPITSPTTNPTPSYSFVSTEPGIIHYSGDCSSPSTSISSGVNVITFNPLSNGTHSNCTITVTDTLGNTSNQLVVSPFTIGTASVEVATTTPTSSPTLGQLQSLQAQLVQLEASQTVPSSSVTYNFTTFLGIGSTGAAVTALQDRLKADGFYAGPITGTFGSLTGAALKKFQSAHNLSPKGYAGPGTRAALNAGD